MMIVDSGLLFWGHPVDHNVIVDGVLYCKMYCSVNVQVVHFPALRFCPSFLVLQCRATDQYSAIKQTG